MDADADAEGAAGQCLERQTVQRGGAILLDLLRGQDRGAGVILSDDRKIEDRHQAVAHLLVDDAVMRPDRLRAAILEQADDLAQLHRLDALRQIREAPDIGKQDGGVDSDLALLLDILEGAFADRADIGVHLAAGDAEGAEGQGKRAADRNRHMHLVPAAATDPGAAVPGWLGGRGCRHIQ